MDFIKATVMDQIEVILPGSAEYDNQTPIINIKLARELPNGIAWELSADANTRGNYGAGIDAVSKVNSIGIGILYNGGPGQRLYDLAGFGVDDRALHSGGFRAARQFPAVRLDLRREFLYHGVFLRRKGALDGEFCY